MGNRLVTAADIERHPELIQQGVSVNQYYDFPEDWEAEIADGDAGAAVAEPPKEEKKIAPKKVAKKTAPKPAAKKVAAKKSGKKK